MLRLSSYLFLLMLFLTACSPNNKNEPKIGEDGFPEFSQEQLQDMIKNNPQAQQQMLNKKADEEIMKKMETTVENNPTDISANYGLAKFYHQKYMKNKSAELCEKAIASYTKVINLQADYQEGRSYYNRMLCYMSLDEYDAALSDLNQFITINQDRTPVNYESMQAEILFQQGNEAAACTAYQTALARYQKDSLPIHNELLWKDRCNN